MCKPIPIDEYPITPIQLIQRYMGGVNLRPGGCPYPDELFDFAIRAATEETERFLGIVILPRTFYGGEPGDVAQMNLLSTEQNENGIYGAERQDWIPYNQYQRMRLNWRPLIGVPTRVRLVLPGAPLTNLPEIPPDWISVRDGNAASIDIVPGSIVGGFYYNGFFAGTQTMWGAWWNNRIPNLMRVDYRAGFLPGCVPYAIQDVIGMWASMFILNPAGDQIAGPGVASASLSLGGLSQAISTTASATNAGYGARIIQYLKQIDRLTKQMRNDYLGFNLVVA